MLIYNKEWLGKPALREMNSLPSWCLNVFGYKKNKMQKPIVVIAKLRNVSVLVIVVIEFNKENYCSSDIKEEIF